MKKIIALFMICFVSAFAKVDDMLGKWITEKGGKDDNQLIVEVYKTPEGKYNGKIVDMTVPVYGYGEYIGQEKMDLKNPDETLRGRKLKGIDFIYDLEYNEAEDKLENGEIYVAPTGKTYHGYMKLQEDGTLLVKGSLDKAGVFGKKQYWKRYQ